MKLKYYSSVVYIFPNHPTCKARQCWTLLLADISQYFLYLSREWRNVIPYVCWSLRVILSYFKQTLVDLSSGSIANIELHRSHAVGAMLFHADGQADVTKFMVAFRSYFSNASKNDIKTPIFPVTNVTRM
jgi:hypothetical protein